MSPDLLEELRDADPARRVPAPADPDWDAMATRITATPRRSRRRRALVLVPALATAAVAAVAVVVALQPAAETEVTRPPAPAAPATGTIYHYVAVSEELAGPDRRPVPDTQGRREGWLDPVTGEKREVSAGSEQTTDADGRITFSQGPDKSAPVPAPAAEGGPPAAPPPDGTVLTALVRPERPLEDRGVTTLDGREVRRFVFENEEKTLRLTYFVDAASDLPVLFRTETGDHLRTGRPIPDDQRLIEERFEVFEALPADADRAVLKPSG